MENVNTLQGQYSRNEKMGKVSASGLPLTMASPGISRRVTSIRGKDEARRFLTNLGFTDGAEVILISENGGNVIVNVRDTRIAISRAMAARILTN